jgi:flagellin FlaB
MIAFVIVAAALAFVVLNMGFSTTQKAKTTIISGLAEASSSLEVSGKIMGIGCLTCNSANPYLNVTAIPLKIVSGGDAVDLDPGVTSVKYLSNTVEYDNIYKGTLNTTTYENLALAAAAADGGTVTYVSSDPVSLGVRLTQTAAFTFWSTTNTPQNSILDEGEHATLVIAYDAADKPQTLDKVRVEVSLPTGAALTVERQVPNISYRIVDMG